MLFLSLFNDRRLKVKQWKIMPKTKSDKTIEIKKSLLVFIPRNKTA